MNSFGCSWGGELSSQLHQPQEGPGLPQPWLCFWGVTAIQHYRGHDLMPGAQPRPGCLWDRSMELHALLSPHSKMLGWLHVCSCPVHQPACPQDTSPSGRGLALLASGKHLHMAGASVTNKLHRVFTGGKAKHPPPSLRCSSPKQLNLPTSSQFLIYTGPSCIDWRLIQAIMLPRRSAVNLQGAETAEQGNQP